jgi:hypothetical protein
MSDDGSHPQLSDEPATSGTPEGQHPSKRFRFKSKPSRRHAGDDVPASSESAYHGYPRSRHGHGHRHKRRRSSPSSETIPQSPYNATTSSLQPDIAFRESLFDAMGDDEGAAYWQSVYGQPIHTYPDEKRNEETGELEKMSEEEYIAFVRRGMWERSWQGIEAQREQSRRDRLNEEKEQSTKRRKKTPRAGESGGVNDFERQVEESLRRGLVRKEKKMWREKWEAYKKGWDELHRLATSKSQAANGTDDKIIHLRNEIIWPVESGRRKDVSPLEIERFMLQAFQSIGTTGDLDNESPQFVSVLKLERVRWHPDKVQQRFGSLNIDEGTLKGVTEVFQVMDRLYNERKQKEFSHGGF